MTIGIQVTKQKCFVLLEQKPASKMRARMDREENQTGPQCFPHADGALAISTCLKLDRRLVEQIKIQE
jgi:hypothetical protein